MNEFFSSLGADLRDKRFMPILVVLGVALIAAVAWAALGGKSSTSSPPVAGTVASVPGAGAGMPITEAPATAPKQALAETTSGAPHQKGTPRDPFKPLPGAKKESSSSSSSSSSASSGGTTPGSSPASSSTPSSAPGSSKTSSPTESTTTSKPKYYIHYHVTVRFGLATEAEAGAEEAPKEEAAAAEEGAASEAEEGAAAKLKLYQNLSVDQALPGKKNAQLIYMGVVVKTGDAAVFAFTGKTRLHGAGHCKPSKKKCVAIELKVGKSETLEVTGPTGEAVIYRLKLVSIKKSVSTKAPTASTARASAQVAQVAPGR
jgi:hypothetical protein